MIFCQFCWDIQNKGYPETVQGLSWMKKPVNPLPDNKGKIAFYKQFLLFSQ